MVDGVQPRPRSRTAAGVRWIGRDVEKDTVKEGAKRITEKFSVKENLKKLFRDMIIYFVLAIGCVIGALLLIGGALLGVAGAVFVVIRVLVESREEGIEAEESGKEDKEE